MTTAMKAQLANGTVRSYANLPIIELLEREQVPATFFLTGMWVEQYPELTGRLAKNPHFEPANHSYGHEGFTANCYSLGRVPGNLMTEDVAKTSRIVEAHGGRQTRYFRFPGLCHDGADKGLVPATLSEVLGPPPPEAGRCRRGTVLT